MRKRELEVFRDELLDVWAADGVKICDFDDLENLLHVSRRFQVPKFDNVREWS